MVTSSPDISQLSFEVLFDISTAPPTIKITNTSVGPNLAGCKWWYEVITPSGVYMHQGFENNPDKVGVWADLTVPENWPLPMGSQIEYSKVPYVVRLYVKDVAGTIFNTKIERIISRPIGLKPTDLGNFAVASVITEAQCNKGQLFVGDQTNYVYGGLVPVAISKLFVLDYPVGPDGVRPPQFVLNNNKLPNVLIPLTQSGSGYQFYYTAVMRYDYPDGSSIQIKYKTRKELTIYCDIDLSPILCDWKRWTEEMFSGKCGDPLSNDNRDKILHMMMMVEELLMLRASAGYNTNGRVGELIESIKKLGGFTCNCFAPGINGINPSAEGSYAFDVCGDIQAVVLSQDGNNVVFQIKDISYTVDLHDDLKAKGWAVAITEAGCTKSYVINGPGGTKFCPAAGNSSRLVDLADDPVAGCPNPVYPFNIYNRTKTAVLGVAQNINDVVSILNSDTAPGGWVATYGKAMVLDNCNVVWPCYDGAPVPIGIPTEPFVVVAPPCVGQVKTFTKSLYNYCDQTQPFASIDFPQRIFVKYLNAGPVYVIGKVNNYADLITALNAQGNKPASHTWKAGSTTAVVDLDITDPDCEQVDTVTIMGDRDNHIAMGGNHHSAVPNAGAVPVYHLNDNEYLGQIALDLDIGTRYPWHIVKYGTKAYIVLSDGVQVHTLDMTNPLFPAAVSQWPLALVQAPAGPHPAALPGGLPNNDTYFPTDLNSELHLGTFLYILESSSGTIWKINAITGFPVSSFYDPRLMGKCPRFIVNNTLYMSQDGNMQASRPVPGNTATNIRDMWALNLSIFSAAGLFNCIPNVANAADGVWALTLDPNDKTKAWASTYKGDIVYLNLSTRAIIQRYGNAWSVPPGDNLGNLFNTHYYNGRLFGSGFAKGSRFIDIADLGSSGATMFEDLEVAPGILNLFHYNFQPIPDSCFGLLTYDNGDDPGGIAKFTLDGRFVDITPVASGDIYNVILYGNISSGKPNGYIP